MVLRGCSRAFRATVSRSAVAAATVIVIGLASAPGRAQVISPPPPTSPVETANTSGLADIVVTAQRRSENLQNVPIAVTVATAAQLSASGITDTLSLSTITPGLNFPVTDGYALPHLRGIGNTSAAPGAENSVALYVDGVYYATPAGSVLGLNNVSQIEVLKGPQGTLFGRNATGGLIQITTVDPVPDFHGKIDVGYANYKTSSLDGYVTGGVAPNLAADFAVQLSHQGDGWGKNLATGQDTYKNDKDISLRSKILWTPSPSTKLRLSMDYETSRNSLVSLAEIPGTYATNPFYPTGGLTSRDYDINENFNPRSSLKAGGVSLKIEHDLGGPDLISTTAYRQQRFFVSVDFDLGPAPLIAAALVQTDKQFTQEFQLQSRKTGPFTWQAGVFYIHENDGYAPSTLNLGDALATQVAPGLFLNTINTTGFQKTDSVAVYGQATYEFLPDTHLTVGGRYTYEKKDFAGGQDGLLNGVIPIPLDSAKSSFSVSKPTWRLSIDHKFADGPLIYASYNRGFKSGGYNADQPTAAPYNTEQLDAYELGLKKDWFGRKLRTNFAVFYYDYKNIQVVRFVQGTSFIYNGARARLYGLDFDADARLTKDLTLSGGFEYLHNRFKSFPCADHFSGGPMASSVECSADEAISLPYERSAKGNRLPDAPDYTGNVSLTYKHEFQSGAMVANITDAYNGGFYWEPDNALKQRRYNLVNASLEWDFSGNRFSIRGFARNLTNVRYSVQESSAATGRARILAAPRTYGVVVGAKF